MRLPSLVRNVEHGLEESQNQRDARVEALWSKLDPGQTGELDLKGLQKGFRKIDHPMKNADELIKEIMRAVDTNKDGVIQYEEFRIFVEQTELKLFSLFKAIDNDGNGKLSKTELQNAFKSAGLTLSNQRLSDFFNDMDHNHDGYVSFDEWRDFLLFMPAREGQNQLQAVLSYYYTVVNVTPEGDSIVSEETLEGLGTAGFTRSLFFTLFGSLFRIAFPFGQTTPKSKPLPSQPEQPLDSLPQSTSTSEAQPATVASSSISKEAMETADVGAQAAAAFASKSPAQLGAPVAGHADPEGDGTADEDPTEQAHDNIAQPGTAGATKTKTKKKYRLTDYVPDPGYFLAGAIAGGVSRTATAPLDRLKVYLLVNTNSGRQTAVAALKQGQAGVGLKNALSPFGDAVRDIYRSGGVRGFFAGNGLNVLKIMPETAIKFGSYEAAKRALANLEGHGDPRNINSYSKFTAGGVAGMIAQFFVYPLDTLKFRLQCETVEGGLTGRALLRQTAVKMYADGGLRAAYRGVTMGLVGMFPYSAIDMGMFEFLKSTYRTYYARYSGCHEDDALPGNLATGMIGATSGAIGASVVYPLNVVRTRLQTQGTVMHRETYTGIWDVTQKTIQREGYRGLYKGLTPNLLKVAPALSITWVMYENSKKMLGLH